MSGSVGTPRNIKHSTRTTGAYSTPELVNEIKSRIDMIAALVTARSAKSLIAKESSEISRLLSLLISRA